MKKYLKVKQTARAGLMSGMLVLLYFFCKGNILWEPQAGAEKNNFGESNKNVWVSVSDTGISIENLYLSREYTIRDGHINTGRIVNKRIDGESVVEMQEGSEDFVIHLIDAKQPSEELDKTGWRITIKNGDGVEFSQSESVRLIDGSTFIHPQIEGSDLEKGPFTVDIDLGSYQTVRSFSIDKRSGSIEPSDGLDGTMGKYQLYVSRDGVNYIFAGEGEFTEEDYHLKEGAGMYLPDFKWSDHLYNIGERVYANFDHAYKTRYVRIVQENCAVGATDDSFSSTEINLYSEFCREAEKTEDEADTITAGKLTYGGASVEDTAEGKKLTIHYEPLEINESVYTIDQVVVLKNDDFYLRSFLEIQSSEKDAAIDYIDQDRFVLSGDISDVWDEGMHSLGQPLYAGGMFLGSEFPAVQTWVSHENALQIRYYSGKSFARLKKDGQLTEDGKFVTWPNVIGVSGDTDINVVQSDFYRYIEDIAVPTGFRKQYNPWFDNAMGITDESIKEVFLGAEQGMSQNGIEPLDSYVVDDGWNNYYDGKYLTEPGINQGTTKNKTGFWETNAKFPDEMYTSSALAARLQSTFGMWLGPQGGYVYDKTFSQFLEAKKTGNVRTENLGDGTTASSYICVASSRYIKNMKKFLMDYDTRFDITYWKLDGFGSACMNPGHGHMTGGDSNMYYTTDMWEKWTDLLEEIREDRNSEGKDLFINATNGTPLSPWILQWVNTVWLNQGGDTGNIGTGERHQQKIYYRDQVYYNQFSSETNIQFPLGHVYNHDPIYAVADESDASPEVFREYLFANAMRGTALWEVYFSPSIMDETYWQIAADVITWAEDNHEVLKNAKYFGNDPAEGVYGYFCYGADQAIISFTNPLDEEQTYTLKIDGSIGADKALKETGGFTVYPYGEEDLGSLVYGDTITVKLKPRQTIIQQYGLSDTDAPEVIFGRSEGNDKIIVKFNERIYLESASIEGKKTTSILQEDYRTVVLQAEEDLEGEKQVKVRVKDMCGNRNESVVTVMCYGKENLIADIAEVQNLKDADEVQMVRDADTGMDWFVEIDRKYEVTDSAELYGRGPFSVCTGIQTEKSDVCIAAAGNDMGLWVDQDGYVRFTVGDVSLTSEHDVTEVTKKAHGTFGSFWYVPAKTEIKKCGKVNDGQTHTIVAVREVNGMLKLYLDGELCASTYEKEKLNQEISGGKMTVGDIGFAGKLAEVHILNRALGYDEVTAYNDGN